jgi:hypothetical protein
VFSNHVVLDRGPSGEAARDAEALFSAIKRGRIFTVIDGLAGPGAFEFTATSGPNVAAIGDDLPLDGAALLKIRAAAPQDATMALLRNGVVVRESRTAEMSVDVGQRQGAYRVEVTIAGRPGQRPIPWLFSNPIYVGSDRTAADPGDVRPAAVRIPAATREARTEASRGSTSEVEISSSDPPDLAWRFALAPGSPAGQFAAVQIPVQGGLSRFDRVRFQVSAERPMRVWFQVRTPNRAGERWGETFYAEQSTRAVGLSFGKLLPLGFTSSARAPLDRVDSLLFVVDTLNTLPGSSGTVRVSDVSLVR